MKIIVTNFADNANKTKLIDAIANIPTEKIEEFAKSVVNIASQYNKTFETSQSGLRCGVQIAPKRIENCLLHIYVTSTLYSFEVSAIADKIKFCIYSCPADSIISNFVESKEMELLFDGFLRENIENYDALLQEEVERIEKAKQQEEATR